MNIEFKNDAFKKTKINFKGFSGGERHIQLENLPTTKPETLAIRCYLRNSDDLMDLLLLQNALDNYYSQAVMLNLEIPYLPYARQDRVCAQGQAFSLQLMARLLSMLHLRQLIVWDCHSQVGLDLTKAINIEASDILASSVEFKALLRQPDVVLICPDKGAIGRCQKLVDYFQLKPMIKSEKYRNPTTGKITRTEVIAEDLTGKTAIITDDICDGGYTFIKIAEQLRKKNVKTVILYVTHGIFSKGLSVFDGLIDKVYTTQSFIQQKHPKLTIIELGEIA